MIKAVLFDFGGVILSSPFEAFNEYEDAHGLPRDLIRTINSTNPDNNAWARLERSEVTPGEFGELFAVEAAEHGHEVDGRAILGLLGGEIRSEMVTAVRRIRAAGFKTAVLTNNVLSHKSERSGSGASAQGSGVTSSDPKRAVALAEVMSLFDTVVESARVGIRKPEEGFYRIALEELSITAPEAVFLDDLGINLKPARAMGMTTIKVLDAEQALADLEAAIGIDLRS